MLNQNLQASKFDSFKWIVVVLLLLGGLVANGYFSEVAWAIRTAIGIVILAVAILIAMQTNGGKVFWSFAQGARVELRKVVWPTRQETVHTTLIVVAMVVFSSLVLWGLDKVIYELMGWLTGLRG